VRDERLRRAPHGVGRERERPVDLGEWPYIDVVVAKLGSSLFVSATSAQRAMSAGRLSIIALYTSRASS